MNAKDQFPATISYSSKKKKRNLEKVTAVNRIVAKTACPLILLFSI